MNELYVATVYIHSDDKEAYTKLFSTKEKVISWVKRMVNDDVAIGWKLDKEFDDKSYEDDYGSVIIFWNGQEDWRDYVEYYWSKQKIDEED